MNRYTLLLLICLSEGFHNNFAMIPPSANVFISLLSYYRYPYPIVKIMNKKTHRHGYYFLQCPLISDNSSPQDAERKGKMALIAFRSSYPLGF
jgi:hypothetical protein